MQLKTRAPQMLKNDPSQPEFTNFLLPFEGKLSASNRWVKLAKVMPWQLIEACYAESLAGSGMGAPAKLGRMAYGALVIKERLGVTDEETVEQIKENPYLQYFLGLHQYVDKKPFDPSMMVHFRKRFTEEHHQLINSAIIDQATEQQSDTCDDDESSNNESSNNSGKLLIDATCTPADITYPTDLGLLAEAREKSEKFIDILHEPNKGVHKKPRTYRQKARKQHLLVAKQKKPGKRKIRKAIGQQLRYLKRNLAHIDTMLENGASLMQLSSYQLRCLQVIDTLYHQQLIKYQEGGNSIPDRIVSISQPHVRPIVRGKASKSTEFGAKISISHLAGGYVSLDKLSWDSYNEHSDLPQQIETYKERFGHYPESVHADQIYRTKANRTYCSERGIRLSAKPLGRPQKETEVNKEELKAQRQQLRQDELDRIPVEGKFGNAKRKGTLGRIMAKLSSTSKTVIHISIIVLNLDKWLKSLFLPSLLACSEHMKQLIDSLLEGLQAASALQGSVTMLGNLQRTA